MSNFGVELAALGAAFLRAAASVLYGFIGQYLSPSKMNLINLQQTVDEFCKDIFA